ncbi:unnamed protein product [Rotaria socialis]|uniref:NAD(P)(+)--arginine ADP-ribosyltransferase n=1 Tax=Rotaria socialis TaxID=392032 RepID=A0A817T3A9_9BILA|nr:unnamed protein product [Rotaria socialis]CAF4801267.1 unnamed protein product [Rotaria socialis]
MAQAFVKENLAPEELSPNQLLIGSNDKKNKENITIIWFDLRIGSDEDTETVEERIRSINDFVIFITDLDECVKYIKSVEKEKIFLITSEAKTTEILAQISSLPQIDSVFIFGRKTDQYEQLLSKCSKITGIYAQIDDLWQSIKEQVNFVNRQIQAFSFFDRREKSTKDLSKESSEFLWFQLFHYAVTRMPRNQRAKEEMVHICKYYYRRNEKETQFIEEFEKEYQPKDAIFWYTKQCFVYKLINKALRTEDIGFLYVFRFYIGDLFESLRQEHEKILSSEENILHVYRGMKLDKVEFERLKENQGKLISTNGYLSTSRKKPVAINFATEPTNRLNIVCVLFHIQCDVKEIDKSIVFADIAEYSEFPKEAEVLFDLNACFLIESITEHDSLQIIKMKLSNEGQKITKHYLEMVQKQAEKLSVSILFGRLLLNLGKYNNSLRYFEQLLKDSQDEDRAWLEFYIGRAYQGKGELDKARQYYELAYNLMKKSDPPRILDCSDPLSKIGDILHERKDLDEALKYYQRALEIREKFDASCLIDIAANLGNIGLVLDEKQKNDEALNYYQRALKMYQEFYTFDHNDIAKTLTRIGGILYRQVKYDEALDYYQQSLKIYENLYPSGHKKKAENLNYIAAIFCQKRNYDQAIDYHEQALTFYAEFYKCDHIEVARNLNNIGACYENQTNRMKALDYYQRSLAMYEKLLPVDHRSRKLAEMNIRRVTEQN